MTTRPLLIEVRPYETPCARCNTHELIDDGAPTFVNPSGRAVCTGCVGEVDAAALEAVRGLDETVSGYLRHPDTAANQEVARRFLRVVAQGAAELLAAYGAPDDVRELIDLATTQVGQA